MSPVRAAKEVVEEVGALRPWTLVLVLGLSGTLGGGVATIPTTLQGVNWVTTATFQEYKEKTAERLAARDTDIALVRQQLEVMNLQLKDLIEAQMRYQDRMQAEVSNLVRAVEGRITGRTTK